jgi:hypothetical protein
MLTMCEIASLAVVTVALMIALPVRFLLTYLRLTYLYTGGLFHGPVCDSS